MLTAKSSLPNIAAKADDLEAIRKAVEDAAAISAGLWLSYLFVFFYIAIAAGAVTHVDLLLESPVKLPFLSIDLPLRAFFFLAPILFIVTHAYTLMHFVLLGQKTVRFHDRLYAQFPTKEQAAITEEENRRNAAIRDGLRRQLPSNIFVQFLAGPGDIRHSGFGKLLKLIAWATLVLGPVALLLLLQIQFLPYHHLGITWTHRIAILADLLLLWWLWRKVLGATSLDGWKIWQSPAKTIIGYGLSIVALLFSWAVATFPSEWQEDHLPSFRIVPVTSNRFQEKRRLASFHDWLFSGEVNEETRRRESLFSNTLLLTGFNFFEASKVDDPKKADWRDHLLSLRRRDLNGAVFDLVVMPKADLEHAKLQGASFFRAHLQGASFLRANLEGANFERDELEGATLSEAKLQGASLEGANLQGSSLEGAQLHSARLSEAKLQGATLKDAKLLGANLRAAELQGAVFLSADMTASQLQSAFVWRADFTDSTLHNVFGKPQWEPRTGTPSATSTTDPYRELRDKFAQMKPLPIEALARLARLDCGLRDDSLASCTLDPSTRNPRNVGVWQKGIEDARLDEEGYRKVLAHILTELACSGDTLARVRGPGFLWRMLETGSEAPGLMQSVMSANCSISERLRDADKETFRLIAEIAPSWRILRSD
jgi:uncharacterized protein YjbI with pentapeptide repeats